jgi:hypothetical protein
MPGTRKKSLSRIILTAVFLILSGWWIFLQMLTEPAELSYQIFGGVYGVMAFLGAMYGLNISRSWGGGKSIMGRSLLMFSLGLLAQVFGQISYSYYVYYKHIEIPYPSIGDVGFFGSILLYIYAVVLLGQAAGVRFTAKSFRTKIQATIVPILILIFTYLFFLKGYVFDWSNPLIIFLDFGYPLGAAVYISLALLAFLLSRRILGGVMKYRILFILLALLIQYLSDFAFLYQAYKGAFIAGGVVDYMYLVSYYAMSMGLLNLSTQSVRQNLDE